MLKMEDLKNKGSEELVALYQGLSREIYGLRCELKVARKLEKPHLLHEKKKDRARVLTALQQTTGKKA